MTPTRELLEAALQGFDIQRKAIEPTVCAIMLTKDRPELAARAVRCFRAQTYANKSMVIYDFSKDRYGEQYQSELNPEPDPYIIWLGPSRYDEPLGAMRNAAISVTDHGFGIEADIIIHWDDDDYSHPNRIAEQVAFLQSSGAAVVGYSQMLFWDAVKGQSWLFSEASHHLLGTSLCYWRSTWESHKFDSRKHAGEDSDFLARVGHRRVKSVSSLCELSMKVGYVEITRGGLFGGPADTHRKFAAIMPEITQSPTREPRLIATVHGANTQQKTYDGFFKGGTVEMRRVAEWDERVRQVLEGA